MQQLLYCQLLGLHSLFRNGKRIALLEPADARSLAVWRFHPSCSFNLSPILQNHLCGPDGGVTASALRNADSRDARSCGVEGLWAASWLE